MNAVDSRLPVALIGLGAIGRAHAERLQRHPQVRLAAVAEPSAAGREFAASLGVPCFEHHEAMFDATPSARAAVVATPNATHLAVGLACIARGLPTLMEKPVADTLAAGEALCAAAEAAGVPLMVAHHRRLNPIARRARELVRAGVLGRPVAAQAMATWFKPPGYFDAAWRREPGGGTVLINLIHDIDLLRYLLGDVIHVQAVTSHSVRGLPVEDTAAVLLRFANGALATLLVSDTAVSPWNWDLAAGEAAHYPRQEVDAFFLSGTEGALTLPRLQCWRYAGAKGWHEPLSVERSALHAADPYMAQLSHLGAVAEGREAPVCSGRDGLASLRVALAVHEAAASGQPVSLGV